MKAIVIHSANDLRLDERDRSAMAPNQVRLAVQSGGICGSDLHYYNHGGFGAVRLREPMVIGHEVSALITEVGNEVSGLHVGQLVAVSPSRPCGRCAMCMEGYQNHCLDMRFYGSAMRFPHVQGAFQQDLVADAVQCVDATGLTPAEAAMAEPLAVTLHATRRAGDLMGKKVLVTGCGPIGLLSIIAARRAGAAEIVATDLSDFCLDMALKVGADRAINTATDRMALAEFTPNKGTFHVLYECSGAPVALASGIEALRPRGIVLQLGLGGDMSVPMMAITSKEIDLRGSFRFHTEFAVGVELMRKKLIDVLPLVTATFALSDAIEAFGSASDRSRSVKTQIDFTH